MIKSLYKFCSQSPKKCFVFSLVVSWSEKKAKNTFHATFCRPHPSTKHVLRGQIFPETNQAVWFTAGQRGDTGGGVERGCVRGVRGQPLGANTGGAFTRDPKAKAFRGAHGWVSWEHVCVMCRQHGAKVICVAPIWMHHHCTSCTHLRKPPLLPCDDNQREQKFPRVCTFSPGTDWNSTGFTGEARHPTCCSHPPCTLVIPFPGSRAWGSSPSSASHCPW